jgi:uncharacterized membrane protein HdeD (DUF308 family)
MQQASAAAPSGTRAILPLHNWKWFLWRGIAGIVLGIVALFFPGLTLYAFALVFAAFSFADGVFSLVAGARGAGHHTERWGALVFSGAIGVAVGVIFFLWPLVATAAYAFMLVVFVALWSLITGVLELSAAIRLRRHIEGEALLAIVGLLSILLGIAVLWLLMTAPGATLISVGWLIGVYALASGVALVVLALRLKRHHLVASA